MLESALSFLLTFQHIIVVYTITSIKSISPYSSLRYDTIQTTQDGEYDHYPHPYTTSRSNSSCSGISTHCRSITSTSGRTGTDAPPSSSRSSSSFSPLSRSYHSSYSGTSTSFSHRSVGSDPDWICIYGSPCCCMASTDSSESPECECGSTTTTTAGDGAFTVGRQWTNSASDPLDPCLILDLGTRTRDGLECWGGWIGIGFGIRLDIIRNSMILKYSMNKYIYT